MPRYYFNIKKREETLPDRYGTDLPDEAAARDHARRVVVELMRNGHAGIRGWRLAVTDEDRRQCFELLFVSYDDSLSHLMPELRSSVETVHRKHASLTDAIVDMRMTLLQVKSTLARANDMPHIAAVDGDRLRD